MLRSALVQRTRANMPPTRVQSMVRPRDCYMYGPLYATDTTYRQYTSTNYS